MLGKPKSLLKDVARAAGVSVATVSRVARGSSNVGLATTEKVRKAAAELEFSLEEARKNRSLAFVLSNREVLHPVHSQILIGAEERARTAGWEMIFLVFRYDLNVSWKELHLPSVAQRGDVIRGVILAGMNAPNLLELLTRKRIPFAVYGNNVVGEWQRSAYDAVYCNDILGGYDAVRYLLSLGHRGIWFVGNCRLPWFARAFEGYEHAMKEAKLPVHRSEIYSEDPQQIGYLAAKSLFAKGEPVTAIFAAHDEAAQGVYKAAREFGLRIPEDLSVIGCNDSYGAVLLPPLTTIRAFHCQLGAAMVDFVLNRIANPEIPPQQATVPTELIKRESCLLIPRILNPASDVHTHRPQPA